MDISQIKSMLWDNGFTMYTTCNCNGNFTEKYKLDRTLWKVNIIPKKGTFFIKFGGNTLTGKKFHEFETIFTSYLIRIKEEAERSV